MNKKDKIMKIFDSKEWYRNSKTITYNDFYHAGLDPTIEYGESYCDVIYARRIFQKLGYTVGYGSCFHIYRKEPE